MLTDSKDIELTGLIDIHIHSAPDVRPRSLDDFEAAQQAVIAGMQGIVLKSHVVATADRAAIAQKAVPGVWVFGGLTLNDSVGGLNPSAVEVALRLGARIIWMPTISALNHVQWHGGLSGIKLLTNSQASPSLLAILELIKKHDVILATGHLSVAETVSLVRAAQDAGVRKIVVTHPEVPWVAMPANVQEELRDAGVYFERCFASTTPSGGGVLLDRIIADIRRVGISSTVLSTDLGQPDNPLPVEGLRIYLCALLAAGFSQSDIQCMVKDNPARLLGLA